MSNGSFNQVLIVENECGDVYIVENDKNFSNDEEMEVEYLDENFSEIPVDFIDANEDINSKINTSRLYATSNDPKIKSNNVILRKRDDSTSSQTMQDMKFFCRYCNTVFKDRNEQWMHLCQQLIKCDPSNYICKICCKEVDKKKYEEHSSSCEEKYECKSCQITFYNLKDFIDHKFKLSHTSPKKTVVDYDVVPDSTNNSSQELATKTEKSINVLLRRKGVRTKVKYPRKKQRFECDLCGKYLVSSRSLHFHMNLHKGDSSYICDSCGEVFFTPNGIKGHSCEKKRRRPVKDFRTYDMRHCRFCDQRFPSLDENKAHKCEFQHPDDQKLVFCRCCGKVLAKLAFNRHMETHSGIDWICSICNRKLATERALKTHLTTHTGNKPYKCNECSESFINKVVLDRHKRFHGKQPTLFGCEYCFKQLSTETSLKSHVQRLHKNSVHCELCKMEFSNRDQLKDHLQSSHEPSVCNICGKSFSLPRYLKMHEKLHYDDNSLSKLSCTICSKQLTAKNMKHHVYRHHINEFEFWLRENPHL